MAHYTVELNTLIKNNFNPFNHINYNLYNNDYKPQFEEKFIKHFYYRELGVETVARFINNLEEKLNLIYPYYEHLYRTTQYDYDPILNYNVEEKTSRDVTGEKNENTSSKSTSRASSNGENYQYDTPIMPLSNMERTPSYVDKGNTTSENSGSGSQELSNNTKEVEKYDRTMKGNIGVMTTQDLIMKEREIIINIDSMIFDECEDLFMQVF